MKGRIITTLLIALVLLTGLPGIAAANNHTNSSTAPGEDDETEFTDVESLADGEYRIIEVSDNDLEIHNDSVEAECPELEGNTEEDLNAFCLHREEEGFCTALGQPCVIQE